VQDDPGYSIYEHVFDPAEMSSVVEAFANAGMPRTKAGSRHVLTVAVIRALAADPRLMRIAAQFVGPEPVPFRATLFDKSPASNCVLHIEYASAADLGSGIELAIG
jgi:hypothetical protein